MKLFMTSILTFLFSAQASLAGQCPSLAPEVRAQIKSQMAAELSESAVGAYVKSVPATYASIFFNDQDYPLSVIESQATKSRAYWGKSISAQDQSYYASFNFDWQSFQDLNQQADKTWNLLRACNAAQPQSLRTQYFTALPCGGNTAEGRIALNELQTLMTNLVQYLKSMPLLYKKNEKFNFVPLMAELNVEIPAQHPLLYQMMLQTWSTQLNLANEEPKKEMFFRTQALRELYVDIVKENDLQGYENEYKNGVKAQYNLLVLLGSQSADCAALGLWPAMNRALVFIKDYSSTPLAKLAPRWKNSSRNTKNPANPKSVPAME